MNLRDYQLAATEAARKLWKRRYRNALIVLPTGTGKTLTALSEVAKAVRAGRRVLWLGHREELIDQPYDAFAAVWGDLAHLAGIAQANRDDCAKLLTFASTDTIKLKHRLARYLSHGVPTLVVVDEGHHYIPTNTFGKLLIKLDEAGTEAGTGHPYKLALTATPDRADKKSLRTYWTLAKAYSIISAIEAGHLVQPIFRKELLPDLDLDAVATGANGDFVESALGVAMIAADVVEHTVAAMEPDRDRRTIVFTATVEQARLTAEALCEAGWVARWLCGETPTLVRRNLIREFRAGTIQCLCNVDVLTEGTDIPPVDCIVMARPTRSRPRYMQALGRGLRPSPSTGKQNCLIVDLVGASSEHRMIVAPILLAEERKKARQRKEIVEGSRVVHLEHPAWGTGRVLLVEEDDTAEVEWPKSAAHPDGIKLIHPLEELALKVRPRGAAEGEEDEETWTRKIAPRASWVRVRSLNVDAWAVDCGKDHGRVAVLQGGALFSAGVPVDRSIDLWRPYLIPPKGDPIPLADGAVPFDLACGLGEDVARQAGTLTGKEANWRKGSPTDAQLRMLRQFAVDVDALEAGSGEAGFTRGLAADALTEQFTKRDVARCGLGLRTDK